MSYQKIEYRKHTAKIDFKILKCHKSSLHENRQNEFKLLLKRFFEVRDVHQ